MRSHTHVTLVPVFVLLHQAGCLPIPVVSVPAPGTGDVPGKSIAPFSSADSLTSCSQTVGQWHAWVWKLMFMVAVGLVLLTGLLAGLTLAVLSADLPRLMVWTRTGSAKRRKHAQMILGVRNRPNWLLVSLILSSVMVAEGLPLILSHLFPPGSWAAFAISTLCVAVIGEILPQAIMPLFVLEFAGRMMWFVRALMWLMAIPGVLFAYPLRLFKTWKKKRHPYKMDGILELDELIEFIRLHEHGEGLGGRLEDGVGCIARMMMVQQEDVQHWESVVVLHSDPQGGSTIFQRYANTVSESNDILSPMAESSRGSSNETTRGLRRRTNRSSEAYPGTFSEKGPTAFVPNSLRIDSTAEKVVDQPSYQIEDRSLGDIPLNKVSTTSSRRRPPSKFDQVDGPSIPQVDRLSFCDMADGPLRQKARSTSGQWVKALVRDLNTLTQSAKSPVIETAHCSSWKNFRNGCRSASTGTLSESHYPSCRRNAQFWTSGHMPRSRQSVYSYFKVEDGALRVAKKTD